MRKVEFLTSVVILLFTVSVAQADDGTADRMMLQCGNFVPTLTQHAHSITYTLAQNASKADAESCLPRH